MCLRACLPTCLLVEVTQSWRSTRVYCQVPRKEEERECKRPIPFQHAPDERGRHMEPDRANGQGIPVGAWAEKQCGRGTPARLSEHGPEKKNAIELPYKRGESEVERTNKTTAGRCEAMPVGCSAARSEWGACLVSYNGKRRSKKRDRFQSKKQKINRDGRPETQRSRWGRRPATRQAARSEESLAGEQNR